MSYSVSGVCWKCANQKTCTDGKLIQDAVNKIHENSLSADGPHAGSGTIVHQCSNLIRDDLPLPV